MDKGEIIKRLRERKGLSQVELADKIGVSKQTLYKYEKGIVTNIPSDKIEALAKALGTTPEVLMGWTDSENLEGVQINEHHTEYYIDAETRKLAQELHDNPDLSVMLDAYKTLSPRDAKLVMEMVRRMQNEGNNRT